MVMERDPRMMDREDRPRFVNLTEEQQQRLRKWKANVNSGTGSVGLWVCGPRGTGSSYIAWLAMNSIWREHKTWTHAKYPADQITAAKRELWSLERNPNRYDSEELTTDYYHLYEDFKKLREGYDYLWVDDLYEVVDMEFWMRHVHPDLEWRAKNGKPVVIATDMAPNHPVMEKIRRVIEHWFVVIVADYAGR